MSWRILIGPAIEGPAAITGRVIHAIIEQIEMTYLKDLREKIPWFPTIDAGECRADLQCVNFCPHDVFEWNPRTGRPMVAHPLRCLPGCQICLEMCDTGAISLPTKEQFRAYMKKLRGTAKKTQSLPTL